MPPYIDQRRGYLIGRPELQASFAITTGGGQDFETTAATLTLEGTASVTVDGPPRAEVWFVTVNGLTTEWAIATQWSIPVTLPVGNTTFTVVAHDRLMSPISGYSDTITITRKP